jgi:hypothetical protein
METYQGYTYKVAENGEAELRLSSGDWQKFPSTDDLKTYVDGLTRNTSPQRSRSFGRASRIFRVLFWIHQVLFGLPAVLLFFEVINIARGNPSPLLVTTTGFGIEIVLLLTWIGGTLLWGLASLLHRPPTL